MAAKGVHATLSHRFARLTEDLMRELSEVSGRRGDDHRFAQSNALWAAEASALVRKIDPDRASDVGSMLREVVIVLKTVPVDRGVPPDYVREKYFAIVEHLWFESACA